MFLFAILSLSGQRTVLFPLVCKLLFIKKRCISIPNSHAYYCTNPLPSVLTYASPVFFLTDPTGPPPHSPGASRRAGPDHARQRGEHCKPTCHLGISSDVGAYSTRPTCQGNNATYEFFCATDFDLSQDFPLLPPPFTWLFMMLWAQVHQGSGTYRM